MKNHMIFIWFFIDNFRLFRFSEKCQIFFRIFFRARFFFSESEKNLDHYSDSKLHALSNGAIFRSIPALLPSKRRLWKNNSFFSHYFHAFKETPNKFSECTLKWISSCAYFLNWKMETQFLSLHKTIIPQQNAMFFFVIVTLWIYYSILLRSWEKWYEVCPPKIIECVASACSEKSKTDSNSEKKH